MVANRKDRSVAVLSAAADRHSRALRASQPIRQLAGREIEVIGARYCEQNFVWCLPGLLRGGFKCRTRIEG